MHRKKTLEELKAEYPQSWAKRNEYGQLDEKKIANPLARDESTWSPADYEYVKETIKANADKLLAAGKSDKYNQMLIDELTARRPHSGYNMSDAELNRVFGDTEE
jgi:hypothetical protein